VGGSAAFTEAAVYAEAPPPPTLESELRSPRTPPRARCAWEEGSSGPRLHQARAACGCVGSLSSPARKNILIFRIPKSLVYGFRPVPLRGAARDRHGRGAGCDGRGGCRRRGCPRRTVKSYGPDASAVGVKLGGAICEATVSTKPDHRGEYEVSCNPLRGECRVFPV
jgi:hypothetical protein